MKFLNIIAVLLLSASAQGATLFTEWYCNITGTNVNAGSTTNAVPTFGTTAGDWVASTGVYTKSGANLSAVTVGMWASVYPDAATVTPFVGRITAVDDGADTITVSLTVTNGTPPTDGTGNRSINVEGAWRGPYLNEFFPFNFISGVATNTSLHAPCVNMRGTFSVTNRMTNAMSGPVYWWGYTNTPRDGGYAIIDGGATGAGYDLYRYTGIRNTHVNIEFQNNGNSGSGSLVISTQDGSQWWKCKFHDARSNGILLSQHGRLISCEAYNCGLANGVNTAGFNLPAFGAAADFCYSHDNTNANVSGFLIDSSSQVLNSVSTRNRTGIYSTQTGATVIQGTDIFGNVSHGINVFGGVGSTFTIINCNIFSNGGWGIVATGTPIHNGVILNCAFGSGNQTNVLGDFGTNIYQVVVQGTINYPASTTPWVAPNTGNFSYLAGSPGINAGYATFTQTSPNSGTVSYPDIGSTQTTNASVGVTSFPIFRR